MLQPACVCCVQSRTRLRLPHSLVPILVDLSVSLVRFTGEGSEQYLALKERVEGMKADLAKLSKGSVDSVRVSLPAFCSSFLALC